MTAVEVPQSPGDRKRASVRPKNEIALLVSWDLGRLEEWKSPQEPVQYVVDPVLIGPFGL